MVRRNRRLGFTLVELLVVIGIIAVLIAMLMPALTRVRHQAATVKCLSNLRQIGQSIVIYANNHKGTLPYGYWDGISPVDATDAPAGGSAIDWATLLSGNVMGGGGITYGDINPGKASQQLFACPSAVDFNNTSGRILHYSSHPRLMPSLHTSDASVTPAKPSQPYKIQQVRRSSEIILIFDAIQNLTPGAEGNVVTPSAFGLDEDGYFRTGTQNGRRWHYLLSDGNMDLSTPVYTPNKDWKSWSDPIYGAWVFSNFRWRHGRNDAANFVFADGHAESRSLKLNRNAEITARNCYIDAR